MGIKYFVYQYKPNKSNPNEFWFNENNKLVLLKDYIKLKIDSVYELRGKYSYDIFVRNKNIYCPELNLFENLLNKIYYFLLELYEQDVYISFEVASEPYVFHIPTNYLGEFETGYVFKADIDNEGVFPMVISPCKLPVNSDNDTDYRYLCEIES